MDYADHLIFMSNGDGTCCICGTTNRKVTKIIIPKQSPIGDTVTSIGREAFYECSSLTRIEIPESVTSIGDWAFANCRSLTNIEIPESVMSIGGHAFDGCTLLQKKGYFKATTKDMTCRHDFQYTIGEWYEEPKAVLCATGFHYCENAFDLFNYYYGTIGKDIRFFEVEVVEVSADRPSDSKRVCKKIKLVREITSYQELLN